MKSPINRSIFKRKAKKPKTQGLVKIEVMDTKGSVVSGYLGTHTSDVIQDVYKVLQATKPVVKPPPKPLRKFKWKCGVCKRGPTVKHFDCLLSYNSEDCYELWQKDKVYYDSDATVEV